MAILLTLVKSFNYMIIFRVFQDSSDEDMDSISPLHQLFKPPGGHSENNHRSSKGRGHHPARGSLQDGEQSTITCAPIYGTGRHRRSD